MIKPAVVLCLLIVQFPAPALFISCADFRNGDNYSAYESMLLKNDINTVMLEEVFYPTNYHSSVVVDVKYHFIHTSEENILSINSLESEEPWNNVADTEISQYHFRWMVSPINLFIRPGLLSSFSLETYQTRNVSVNLYLSLPYNCTPELLKRVLNASAIICDDPPAHLRHLNTLTANVS